MHLPERCFDELKRAGLLVSEPFVPDHVAFPDGVRIGKPRGVGGHSLPDYQGLWSGEGDLIPLDAPVLKLHASGGRWIVTLRENMPGPGIGDFVRRFKRPEEAVADVVDFFFGDPARMDTIRNFREQRYK